MNGSDPLQAAPPASPVAAGLSELTAVQLELRYLRRLLVTSLVALIILSFSLNVYVFRQVSMVRKELDASNAMLQEYQARREPLINSFVTGLQEFSRSHPDFIPILERYSISPTNTPPSATVPTPAKTGK